VFTGKPSQGVASRAHSSSSVWRSLGVDKDHPSSIVNVYAPISGVIVAQYVTNAAAAGVNYSGSSTAFTIADLSVVWIICDVYENDIPKIHLGQEAFIHANAYPDGTLRGHITDIGPVLDPNIRTAKVRIEIPNPGILKLGMFVTATFESRNKQVFAVVPSTAILHLHDRDWVFIPAGGKQFKRVEVSLDLKHIPANLLSLGALDFGMVVDGSVVMVENIVRHLSHHSGEGGTPAEKIREAAHEVQRPVFFAIGIIITAYLPIFTLQAVEGRLFRPMAWTVAFALCGALIFSMIVAPVLASFLFRKGAKEWTNPIMTFLIVRYRKAATWAIRQRVITVGVGAVGFAIAIYLAFGGVIGSEFLPHLDEGSLWVRGTLEQSAGIGT